MNDELKKCLSGEWYDCHAPIFIEFKKKTNRLVKKFPLAILLCAIMAVISILVTMSVSTQDVHW